MAAQFFAATSPAAADPYRAASLALAQELLALVPASEGYVVSMSGEEAYVDLARKDLLRPGAELQVYRPGAEMVHPVTKQVLGVFEKNLGFLGVTEVREKYSRGTLDAAGTGAGIVPGDRVRISARRLRTLLRVESAAAGIEVGPLAQALIARGEESGRFAMVDEPAWASSLAALGAPWEAVRANPAALRRLGESAAADLLLLARGEFDAIPWVRIEVRSLRTGSVLADVGVRWPAPAPGSNLPVPATAAGEYTVRELGAPVRALAAGDILGEGRLDVLLTDGARLSLYRWERQMLAWRWDEDGRGGRRILSLDVADLDGDGRAEALVTMVLRGMVVTELRRWRDGALRTATTVDGIYLRAAPRPGAPPLLLGQRAGIGEALAGRVEQYRLREGTLEPVAGSALPRWAGIHGFAFAPSGGPVVLYALDRAGHLSGLSADGAALWRSARPYGGRPSLPTARELFGSGPGDEGGPAEEMRLSRGRLLCEEFAGGIRLAVPRNFTDPPAPLGGKRSFGLGEVVILAGPPGSPVEVGRSRPFEGYVSDLWRADIDVDAHPEILFVVNRFAGPLLGERGQLVAWSPPGTADGGK